MRRLLFLLGLLVTCWWGMMLVHEAGHALAAIATGGRVVRVEWPLVGFSRTDVAPNPHPLVVIWGGPALGALMPLSMALLSRACRRRRVTIEVFSGFCLLANGVYLAAGSLGRIGDAGDLLRHGAAPWTLWAIGLPLAAAGLA